MKYESCRMKKRTKGSVNQVVRLVVLLLAAMTLCSCAASVKTLTAERPLDEAFRSELKKEASIINIPIEASTDDLARALNKTVRKDLYKGSTGTRGLTAEVVRSGSIVVSASDNYIYVTLPLAMSLSYSVFESRAIPLTLKFRARAGITPDWKLHTDVSYVGLSEQLLDELGIGPVKIKPRSIIESFTQPVQKVLSDLLAQKVNELFPLKNEVVQVWNTAQKPVLLDRNYNAWLVLTPRALMLYPLYAQNNKVRVSVGVSTYAEMVVGPQPAPRPLLPLPELKQASAFDKTFRIALNADLPYKDLQAIASTLLLGKKFDADGKSIVIKGIDLYGNGDKLVIKLQTEGSLEGVFYLTARPVVNPQTNIFSVEDVDFDLQSQSMLLQSAAWMLHGTIRDTIHEKLNMNLNAQLEQTRQMAGKALARVPLAEHLYLKGDIKKLHFSDMIVQKERISIQVYTEGEAAVFFQ